MFPIDDEWSSDEWAGCTFHSCYSVSVSILLLWIIMEIYSNPWKVISINRSKNNSDRLYERYEAVEGCSVVE